MNTKNTNQVDNQSTPAAPTSGRSRRGFASMDPETRRQIARQGGRAAHASGHAHEFDSEEAREAGRRGGRARWHLNAGQASAPTENATDTKVTGETSRVPSSEYVGATAQVDNFPEAKVQAETEQAERVGKEDRYGGDFRRTA